MVSARQPPGLAAQGFEVVCAARRADRVNALAAALTRFYGDQAKADAVYAGVAHLLTSQDVADCVTWVATRPTHVNIDRMVVRPRAQAANHKVHRFFD